MVLIKWSKLTDISTISTTNIWIDHFDHQNFVIFGMVMDRFGSTILTIEPQFGQTATNRGH
jgi:hypothetical protein